MVAGYGCFSENVSVLVSTECNVKVFDVCKSSNLIINEIFNCSPKHSLTVSMVTRTTNNLIEMENFIGQYNQYSNYLMGEYIWWVVDSDRYQEYRQMYDRFWMM